MHEPPVFGSPPKSLEELGLTGRQFEVLALMMQGKSNKAICRHLDMAEQTVKKHVTAVLKALNASNRTEAVIAAGGLGISSSAGNAKAGPAPEGQAEPRRGVMGESVPLALPEKPSSGLRLSAESPTILCVGRADTKCSECCKNQKILEHDFLRLMSTADVRSMRVGCCRAGSAR
jgi:DNA-binding CsgD family transcriptional regulator